MPILASWMYSCVRRVLTMQLQRRRHVFLHHPGWIPTTRQVMLRTHTRTYIFLAPLPSPLPTHKPVSTPAPLPTHTPTHTPTPTPTPTYTPTPTPTPSYRPADKPQRSSERRFHRATACSRRGHNDPTNCAGTRTTCSSLPAIRRSMSVRTRMMTRWSRSL
jgi:hypothetical protein